MLRNYYHPVDEILADLTEARIAREKVDKALEDVLGTAWTIVSLGRFWTFELMSSNQNSAMHSSGMLCVYKCARVEAVA